MAIVNAVDNSTGLAIPDLDLRYELSGGGGLISAFEANVPIASSYNNVTGNGIDFTIPFQNDI